MLVGFSGFEACLFCIVSYSQSYIETPSWTNNHKMKQKTNKTESLGVRHGKQFINEYYVICVTISSIKSIVWDPISLCIKGDNPLPQTAFEMHYCTCLLTASQQCDVFSNDTLWGTWHFSKAHSMVSFHSPLGQSPVTTSESIPYWPYMQFQSQHPWPHHIPDCSRNNPST